MKYHKGFCEARSEDEDEFKNKSGNNGRGFTLIEILVVIGIIAILAAVVLVAINPNHQFKLARDSQRVSNINSILDAVGQNMAEHSGIFTCASSSEMEIPSIDNPIADSSYSTTSNAVDIADCLVPDYIAALPYDPSIPGAHYRSTTDYNTDYLISQDFASGRIKVTAYGELTPIISVTR